jgi:hypothetical protein
LERIIKKRARNNKNRKSFETNFDFCLALLSERKRKTKQEERMLGSKKKTYD